MSGASSVPFVNLEKSSVIAASAEVFATLLKLVCRLRPSISPIYFALNGFASWAKTIHAHMVQDKNRVVNLFIDIYD